MRKQLVDQNAEDEILFSNGNSLSDSTYVPVKNNGHATESESDALGIRSVRFNKLAEVREMSPHEANEALMSRLSYAASVRIRRQKTNHKTARTALMFCVLVNYIFFVCLHLIYNAISSYPALFSFDFCAYAHSGSLQIICSNWHWNQTKPHWYRYSVQRQRFSH